MGRKAIEMNALDCKTAADWLAYCASRREWSQCDEPTVMISYNGNDSGYKDQLRKHLVPALSVIKDAKLGRSFELWDFAKRGGVHIGQHFPTEVAEKMWRCRAAVVVLSPEYIDSEYCFEIELPFLLWRWQQKQIDLFLFRLNSTVFDNRRIGLPKFGGAEGHVLLSQLVDDRNPSLHLRHDPNNETLFKQLYEDKPAKAEERLTRFSQGISESVELRQRKRESQPPEKFGEEPKSQGTEQVKTTTTSRKRSTTEPHGETKDAQEKSVNHGIESSLVVTPPMGDSIKAPDAADSRPLVNRRESYRQKIAAALIAVASMIVAGGGTYYWQSDRIEQLKESNTLYREARDRAIQQANERSARIVQLEESSTSYREARDQAIQQANENSASVEQLGASRRLYREALDRAIQEADRKQALLDGENDELKATVSKRNLEIASLKTEVATANGLMPAAIDEKRSLESRLGEEMDANATMTKKIEALEALRAKTVSDLQMKTRSLSESQLQHAQEQAQTGDKIKRLESANAQLEKRIAAADKSLEVARKETEEEVKEAVAKATATEAIWGAATKSSSGRVYTIEHQHSPEDAEKSAMALCRGSLLEKSVSGCKVISTYSNSCFVLAKTDNERPATNRFVWTLSDDRYNGHKEMLDRCAKEFHSQCKVTVSSCSPDFLHSTLNETFTSSLRP
jgi:hypothetical protein